MLCFSPFTYVSSLESQYTTVLMFNDHDFVCEYIDILKMSSCLWIKNNSYYHNSNIKEAAYILLLEKYCEYDKKATKAMMKFKILASYYLLKVQLGLNKTQKTETTERTQN